MTLARSIGSMVAALAIVSGACSSSTSPPPSGGSGGSAAGGTQGSGVGGTQGSGGSAQSGTGGASTTQPGSGGAGVGGRPAGTGGSSPATSGGASGNGGRTGTGGSSSLGGTTTQPGTGGATAAGGNPGRDGGFGAGGAAGGAVGPAVDGGGSSTPGRSAGCGKAPTIASSDYNNGHHIAITAASMAREYILNVPTTYDNTKPYKLIIAYHELNGNDDEMYRNKYYHLLPLSNDSAIFVAPNGQQGGKNCTAASGCGWPNSSNSDLALADAVVAQLEENFCIDTNRIFATGWSYGGSMSYKTACERPLGGTTNGFVRAIAVYSGAQLSGTCTPSKPVAYYASHGTNDTVLNYDGGVTLCQNFAKANGCTWATPTKATGNHVCTNLTGCTTGYPTEFCSFVGPHTPDPTDSGGGTSWEYQNVWTFFSQF